MLTKRKKNCKYSLSINLCTKLYPGFLRKKSTFTSRITRIPPISVRIFPYEFLNGLELFRRHLSVQPVERRVQMYVPLSEHFYHQATLNTYETNDTRISDIALDSISNPGSSIFSPRSSTFLPHQACIISAARFQPVFCSRPPNFACLHVYISCRRV